MPTGVSSLYYPRQREPLANLELDNSYFLVRLHDAQAFFSAGWLRKANFLTFTSSVASSFQPGASTQSLHQITTLQKNTPCRLGLSVNLTDWLPARAADWLKVTLDYAVVQDTPFKELVDKMQGIGLVSKVSLVRPDWAVAVKVSEIVGRLLSYLLGEGSEHRIFSLTMDLNLADLKTGYYAVIGSRQEVTWPESLIVDANGVLVNARAEELPKHCYAVIEVLALPRRGEEIAREEAWWELLQARKEQALAARPETKRDRQRVLGEWMATLTQVRSLARKERGYLLREIADIIRVAQVEVENHVMSKTTAEAKGAERLPEAWQELLGVHTGQELRRAARDYQDALKTAHFLLEHIDCQEVDNAAS